MRIRITVLSVASTSNRPLTSKMLGDFVQDILDVVKNVFDQSSVIFCLMVKRAYLLPFEIRYLSILFPT